MVTQPTLTLGERLAAEAATQTAQLQHDFAWWRRHAAAIDEPVAARLRVEHHSQVTRITAQLERLLDRIDALAGATGDADEVVEHGRRATVIVRGVQQLWGFFRRKLLLRASPARKPLLACADDYAWACFKPLLDLGVAAGQLDRAAVRAPPLVYFADEQSPVMQGRPNGSGLMSAGDLPADVTHERKAVARCLPVPMIGLPWRMSQQMSAIVLVGHEVGHVVCHDLGWLPSLQAQIEVADIPDKRRSSWQAWADELFADAYGMLWGGTAYMAMLALENVGEPGKVRDEVRPNDKGKWTRYPSRWLRLRFCEAVRAKLGYADGNVWSAWVDTYASHSMALWEADIDRIVSLLLDGQHVRSINMTSLSDVGRWSSDDVGAVTQGLRTTQQLSTTSIIDVVSAVALMSWADPQQVDAALSSRIAEAFQDGTAVQTRDRGRSTDEGALSAAIERDRARDDALLALFGL